MVSINKLETLQNEELFILIDHGDYLNIRIQLLNPSKGEAYKGNLSDIQLRSFAAKVHMRYDVYLSETLNVLGHLEDEIKYNFSLENADERYVFHWIKLIDNGIKARMGEVIMTQVDYTASVSDILLFLCLETQKQRSKNTELERKMNQTEKDISDSQNVLDETLKAKNELECELFSKFALVLNSKKRKIRELHEIIEDLKNNSVSNKKQKRVKVREYKHAISDTDRNDAGPSNIRDVELSLDFPHNSESLPQRTRKPRTRIKAKQTSNVICDEIKESKPIVKRTSDSDDDIDAMLEMF